VVVHPGAAVPARRWEADRSRAAVRALVAAGHRVVVTGSRDERPLTAYVAAGAPHGALDTGGQLSLAELAEVLASASSVVCGNTGPAHLAAAVGTPVVSIFAPTVPAARWRPWRVPHVLLGDQDVACAGCRARTCPLADHACLSGVTPADVVGAVEALAGIGEAVAS
jgi:ADP-heptose:LPS heptosyltransferase